MAGGGAHAVSSVDVASLEMIKMFIPKALAFRVALIAAAAAIGTDVARATDYYVSTTCSDFITGTTVGNSFATVSRAQFRGNSFAKASGGFNE